MVKLFSEVGGVTRALLLDAEMVSGLLIVTNFLDNSALRVDRLGFAGFATTRFFTTALFAAAAFCTCVRLARLIGITLAAFFAGFATTTFLAAGFLTTTLRAAAFEFAFATPFFGATDFVDFFDFFATAADFDLDAGLTVALRDPPAAPRGPTFARTGACAVFARVPVFRLIFTIFLAYLVTRRSRVIA